MDHQDKVTNLLNQVTQAEELIAQAISDRDKLYDDLDDYIGTDFSVVKNLSIDTIKELSAISSIAKNYLDYYSRYQTNTLYAVIEFEGEASIVEAEIHNYIPYHYPDLKRAIPIILYQGKIHKLEDLSYIDTDPKWLEPKAKELNLKLKSNKLLADSKSYIASLQNGDEVYIAKEVWFSHPTRYEIIKRKVSSPVHTVGSDGWKKSVITLSDGSEFSVDYLIGKIASSEEALRQLLTELNSIDLKLKVFLVGEIVIVNESITDRL